MKHIIHNQMQEMRYKGLCYYCDEEHQPRHKCNLPKIYLLEGMEVEPEEEEGEEGFATIIQPRSKAELVSSYMR